MSRPSGAEFRKRKAEKNARFESVIQKCKKLDNYFSSSSGVSTCGTPNCDPDFKSKDGVESSLSDTGDELCIPSDTIEKNSEKDENLNEVDVCNNSVTEKLDLSDPASWPKTLNTHTIDHLISLGPQQIKLDKYPSDVHGRHFSDCHYNRMLLNGEKILRKWLLYSKSTNRIFCFCCLCFDQASNDWFHLSSALQSHEKGPNHMNSYQIWVETASRLQNGETIDKAEQLLIEKESERWRNVLTRLMNIILYLAENNMAFRGSSDKLYTKNNGKYLGLVQLLATFDPVMQYHIGRVLDEKSGIHYCGKNIMNELIHLLAKNVTPQIVSAVQKSKYFSIIADCTPDVSHVEQLSLTLRYVDLDSNDSRVEICERFLGFTSIDDSTGSGLTNVMTESLQKHELEIKSCRGQGYDNGANMKGQHQGAQKRILDINPLAFFVPCACHSLNLVLCDAAKSSVINISFFGILGRLYSLFAASTHRWEILTKHLKNFVLKRLCDTRWEAKVSSVKSVRFQIGEVHDALFDLAEQEKHHNSDISHEATTIIEQLEKFDFFVSLVIWYDILFQVHIVSKSMQGKNLDLCEAVKLTKECTDFLREYKRTGFEKAVASAAELAQILEVEAEFKMKKRVRYVKKNFDYESRDEPIGLKTPKKQFEIDFFNPLMDCAINSVQERFKQLDAHAAIWGFLYDIQKLPAKEQLEKDCDNLQKALTVDTETDVDGKVLCHELLSIQKFSLVMKETNPLSILNFIKNKRLEDLYPNIWIALRILLTMPVSVASGERSFSKLKLIKTFLRSTITQENMNALAVLSIENELARSIDLVEIIKVFASAKARRVVL